MRNRKKCFKLYRISGKELVLQLYASPLEIGNPADEHEKYPIQTGKQKT
jgi:hypothetical protein